MIISLKDGIVVLHECFEGNNFKRVVSSLELISILTKSTSRNLGPLPPNTRYVNEIGDELTIVIEMPAQKHRVLIKHDMAGMNMQLQYVDDVPLPSAVFIFYLRKTAELGLYKLQTSKIYAIKSSKINTLDDELYLYPTPNINVGTQHICWGRGSGSPVQVEYKNLLGLEGAIGYFYVAGFNDHLFEHKRLSDVFDWSGVPNVRRVEDFFTKLKNHGLFLESWLRPAQTTLRKVLGER